jgi:carboxyl-terminal processing protease
VTDQVNHNNNQRKYSVWEPLLIALASAIGLLAGYNMNEQNIDDSMIAVELTQENVSPKDGKIEEIIRFIETNYVDSVNAGIITVDAIRHIMKQLDPHSDYISADELETHNERMDGAYRGIGIETIKLRDTFYVSRLLDEGPGKSSGLKLGDAILAVGSMVVAGNETTYQILRDQLKSQKSKTLDLTVQSLDGRNHVVTNIPVSAIPLASADLSYLLDNNTAYIKLVRFSSNTYEQFIESVDQAIHGKEYINLVIDLRENPGGYLPEAIKILSQLFDEKDRLLTYTEGLNRKKAEYRSTGKNFYNIKKVAVLINDYSASGSEIMAGCIQDWDRGVVIGNPSFGKGLVQEIFPLKNGGALRLTVAKYYTPSGRLIQKSYNSISKDFIADSTVYTTQLLNRKMNSGKGIEPDIFIENDQDIACYIYENYIDFFIIQKMIEQGSSDYNAETMTELELDKFIQNEYHEELEIIKNQCNKDIKMIILGRHLRMIEGEEAYQKFINESDPYVMEALKTIGNNKTTLALLSEE